MGMVVRAEGHFGMPVQRQTTLAGVGDEEKFRRIGAVVLDLADAVRSGRVDLDLVSRWKGQ
jgi:hypothetical protein